MMTYAMKATEMAFAQKYHQNQRGKHRSLRQTSLRHHARNNGQYIPHRSENRQPSDHLRTDICMKFAQTKSMLTIQLKNHRDTHSVVLTCVQANFIFLLSLRAVFPDGGSFSSVPAGARVQPRLSPTGRVSSPDSPDRCLVF